MALRSTIRLLESGEGWLITEADLSLVFDRACEQALAWLESEFGFGRIPAPVDTVEYRSGKAYFLVARVGASDPSRAAIEARLGELDRAEDTTEGLLRAGAREVHPPRP